MSGQVAAPMREEVRGALVERLTAMADDELLLGHRDSEWTGHAPLLEEDIALANLAQDEIGHAQLWYELRGALDGSDPDRLVFQRAPEEYRSCRLVELPKGDWAFTMARQFIFDAYEAELVPRLTRSAWTPLAEAAAKVAREELFHLRHSGLWFERLALGTDESRTRLEAALQTALPELPGLLAPLKHDRVLVELGHLPDPAELTAAVYDRLERAFEAAEVATDLLRAQRARSRQAARSLADATAALNDPGEERRTPGPERSELLADMQSVARADPGAQAW